VAVAAVVAAMCGTAEASAAGPGPSAARLSAPSPNPLVGHPWGIYRGNADGLYPAWQAATGRRKKLLAKEALTPRVRWFGAWIAERDIKQKVSDYIAQTQNGDPDAVVQMAIFRVFGHGEKHKSDPITVADRRSYRRWVNDVADVIRKSGARVAMVLEPDLGVSLTGWRPRVRLGLARYSAQLFSSLPNTTVYLDASDSDWLKVPDAVRMLRLAGVEYVRGFALGATHYTGTRADIAYGRQLVAGLAKAGIPGKHFVIDTADNGRPFTWAWYWKTHPRGDFNNAETCRTRTQRRCDTLGIPPTTNVAALRWPMSPRLRRMARRNVDAYLWFGRPWLYEQKAPFDLQRALAVARTTPY
jgi:hypothetical protein